MWEAGRNRPSGLVENLAELYPEAGWQRMVANGIDETLSYYRLPPEHWRCHRTNNPLERLGREIRRRTRVVGGFPDGKSALMLVAARLRHVAAKWTLPMPPAKNLIIMLGTPKSRG